MIIIGRRNEIRKKTARAAAYRVTPIRLFLQYAAFILERDEDEGRTANVRRKIETGTPDIKGFAIPHARRS